MVWMRTTLRVVGCAADALEGEIAWSDIYDDDGETTRYKTHGEHWRAHAGFSAVRCDANAKTDTAGRLSLHFQVSHSSYAVAHERVQWTVRELADVIADVNCALEGSSQVSNYHEDKVVAWSHSAENQELIVTAPLWHTCIVRLSAA